MLWKTCFVVVIIIVVAASALILRKEQEQEKWQFHLDWLRFALSVIVVLCFVTVIATTLFLSFNLWVSQGGKELARDPGYCYSNLLVIKILFLCFLISFMEAYVGCSHQLPTRQSIAFSPLTLQMPATKLMTSTIRL